MVLGIPGFSSKVAAAGSGDYKPLPQVPPQRSPPSPSASTSLSRSASPPLSSSGNSSPRSARLAQYLPAITEAKEDELDAFLCDSDSESNSGSESAPDIGAQEGNSGVDLQNRHTRPRSLYAPQTPTIYEDDGEKGDLEKMSAFGSTEEIYGPSGVAADYGRTGPTGESEQVTREGRKGDRTALLVALGALGTLLIGAFAIILANHPSSLGLFAGHPPLQALAITCFGLGILTLQPTSQPKTKAAGLGRHQLVILGIGLPSIVTGTTLIYANKTIHEAPHFTTWHGTFGLISVVWMVGQMLLGGLSVWFGGRAFGGGMKAKSVWKYHRASGYLLFPMFLMTAAVGGNYSSWTAEKVNIGVRVLVFTLAPIFALVAIWSRARLSKMNFRPQ